MDGYMSKLQKGMVGDRPNQHQVVKEQSDLESHLRMLQILKRIEDEYGTIDIPNMISVLQTVQDYREKHARMMNHQTMLQKRYYEQMVEFMNLSQQRQQPQQLLESTSPKQIAQSQDHNRNGGLAAAGRMSAFTPVTQHFMPQNPDQHSLQQRERTNDANETRNMDLLSLVSEKLSSLQNEGNYAKRRDDTVRPSFLSGPVKGSQGYKNPVEEKLADSVLAGAYENRVDESLLNKETPGPPAFDIVRDRLVHEHGRPIERVEKRMTNSSYLVRFNVTAEMASKLLPPIPKHVEEMKKSNEFKSVFKHDIILVDVFGRNHSVKYEGIVSSRQRHNRLTTGWCSAARSIGLDVGDKIIFERWTEDRRIIHILVEKDPEFASDDSSSRKRARC